MLDQSILHLKVSTDYVTKWAEAKALVNATEKYVVDILFEEIFRIFGVPIEIVTNQGSQSTSKLIQ